MRASSIMSKTPTPLALTSRSACRALFERLLDPVLRRRINDDPGPVRVRNVAMTLTVVGVGLVERDAVPAGRQSLQDAAVIRGGAVPVRRDEARSEERDRQTHCAPPDWSSGSRSRPRERQITSSSSTRWAQVCRALTVASPRAPSEAAKAAVGAQIREMAAHGVAVARDEKIVAGREQVLAIAPRRADERDAAGQRLEDADRRDAR